MEKVTEITRLLVWAEIIDAVNPDNDDNLVNAVVAAQKFCYYVGCHTEALTLCDIWLIVVGKDPQRAWEKHPRGFDDIHWFYVTAMKEQIFWGTWAMDHA